MSLNSIIRIHVVEFSASVSLLWVWAWSGVFQHCWIGALIIFWWQYMTVMVRCTSCYVTQTMVSSKPHEFYSRLLMIGYVGRGKLYRPLRTWQLSTLQPSVHSAYIQIEMSWHHSGELWDCCPSSYLDLNFWWETRQFLKLMKAWSQYCCIQESESWEYKHIETNLTVNILLSITSLFSMKNHVNPIDIIYVTLHWIPCYVRELMCHDMLPVFASLFFTLCISSRTEGHVENHNCSDGPLSLAMYFCACNDATMENNSKKLWKLPLSNITCIHPFSKAFISKDDKWISVTRCM